MELKFIQNKNFSGSKQCSDN